MIAARHVRNTDLEKQRRTAKFFARLLGTLSWIIVIVTVTVFFILLMLPPGPNTWSWALALIGTGIAGGVLIFLTDKYQRRILEKARYGIKSLGNSGAEIEANTAVFTLPDRRVVADVVRTTGFIPGDFTGPIAEAAYTRIRVEHKGKLAYIIQLPLQAGKRISFLDKDIYIEWRREYGRNYFQPIPQKVQIQGREVPSAFPDEITPTAAERAERILDLPQILVLQGLITIEPDQVLWVRRKDLLPQEFLENAVNMLVGIAQRIDTRYRL